MALIKDTLKAQIQAAFMVAKGKTENPEAAISDLSDAIATAIDTYVKAGVVNSTVAGSCPNGAVTGTAVGNMT